MATNDETSGAFTDDDLISLGKKLASLDLTEPEQAALGALISDDVAGFGRFGAPDLIGGIRLGIRAVRGPSDSPNVAGVRKQGVRANLGDIGDIGKPGRF